MGGGAGLRLSGGHGASGSSPCGEPTRRQEQHRSLVGDAERASDETPRSRFRSSALSTHPALCNCRPVPDAVWSPRNRLSFADYRRRTKCMRASRLLTYTIHTRLFLKRCTRGLQRERSGIRQKNSVSLPLLPHRKTLL